MTRPYNAVVSLSVSVYLRVPTRMLILWVFFPQRLIGLKCKTTVKMPPGVSAARMLICLSYIHLSTSGWIPPLFWRTDVIPLRQPLLRQMCKLFYSFHHHQSYILFFFFSFHSFVANLFLSIFPFFFFVFLLFLFVYQSKQVLNWR